MRSALTFMSAAFAACSALSGPLTRYDIRRPFETASVPPENAVRWTSDLYRDAAADTAEGIVGPLWDIGREEVSRWRRLGVRTYAMLPAAGARTNAVAAYLLGFDGIVAAGGAELTEGLKDVEALSRMNELAHKVCTLKSPDKVALEGRMGLFQLDRIDVAADDPDVCRLEAYARIRRLAAFAREPEGVKLALDLPPRPELRRQEIKVRRRGQPTKEEVDAALRDLRYVRAWESAFWTYRVLYSRADGERHVGYPDPGVETFCWRQYDSEKMFQERCFEKLVRKYGETVDLLRYDPKSDNVQHNRPKVLGLEEREKREVYDRLPDLANVVEEARRLRIAYYLDRFDGRPVPALPPPVKKRKVVLELDTGGEDLGLDLE